VGAETFQLVTSIVGPVGSGLAVAIGAYIAKEVRIMKNRQQLTHLEIIAIDYALEKSIGNGYSGFRKSKLNELLKSDVYIKTGE